MRRSNKGSLTQKETQLNSFEDDRVSACFTLMQQVSQSPLRRPRGRAGYGFSVAHDETREVFPQPSQKLKTCFCRAKMIHRLMILILTECSEIHDASEPLEAAIRRALGKVGNAALRGPRREWKV